MTEARLYNVYCDESCHLEHDRIPVMALGAVWCEAKEAHDIAERVRAIKLRHGLAPDFEVKWTKVSPAKIAFYRELVAYFLDDDRLRFRGLVVPDKSRLDHSAFRQTHDDWYYKMYYFMLKFVVVSPHHYRVYLDVKDTRGGPKTRKLHEVLANTFRDFDREFIERVQQVRSHQSELLQIADLLIGALTYANRRLATSPAKGEIVALLRLRLGDASLTQTSSFGSTKFNVLIWDLREAPP